LRIAAIRPPHLSFRNPLISCLSSPCDRVRDEMERDTKRKAPGSASTENEGRASKRLKLPVSAIKCARRGIVGGA